TQAVADYELLSHDVRRYKEVLNYFVQAEKGVTQMVKGRKHFAKDEHVLRSLFVDRIDAYTGEGYSLVTMARRWPTIITDFIRMRSEWDDVQQIKRELDVTMAEATVLKTKNKLFKEWKALFFPTIKDRLARIENLANARKMSIDSYREWVTPYVARFKMMKETTESPGGRADMLNHHLMTPGAGLAQSESWLRIWTWKPLVPQEFKKPERVKEKKGFIIDPYDNFVKDWQEKINHHYHLVGTKREIKEEEVRKMLHDWTKPEGSYPMSPETNMDPDALYYSFFDIKFLFTMLKTPPPKGIEVDNPMLWIRGWVVSQNVLLVHLLEMEARKRALEMYIGQLVGLKEGEEEIKEKIEKIFEAEQGPQGIRQSWQAFTQGISGSSKHIRKHETFKKAYHALDKFAHLFVRYGPYEPVFKERVSKGFTRELGIEYTRMVEFMLRKMESYRDMHGQRLYE
ncbi:MAG: hypothetical protein HY519_00300, partial [Candidatus Aenigmarchaeota archaeon]|nr:hypothetical protein [Candidatus Aenigmarchaeota archaeon]